MCVRVFRYTLHYCTHIVQCTIHISLLVLYFIDNSAYGNHILPRQYCIAVNFILVMHKAILTSLLAPFMYVNPPLLFLRANRPIGDNHGGNLEKEISANVVINHLNAKDSGRAGEGGGGTDTRPSSPLPPVFIRLSPLGQLTPCIPSCLKESDESQLSGLSRLNSGSKRWPSGPAFLAWYVFSCLTPLSGLSWLRFGQLRPEAKVSVTEFSLPRPLPAKFRD